MIDEILLGLHELGANAAHFARQAIDFSPRLVAALLFLLAGWFVARLAGRGTRRLLLAFNDVLMRRWGRPARIRVDLSPAAIRLASGLARWTLLLFVLAGASQIVGLNAFSSWFSDLVRILPSVITGGIFVFLGYIVGQVVKEAVSSFLERASVAQAPLVGSMAQALVVVTALVLGLSHAGIDTTLMVLVVTILFAGLVGGISLAFGLGARDLVANLIGIHHFRRAFTIGQTARIGAVTGEIAQITPTCVVLVTAEGRTSIPGRTYLTEPTAVVDTREPQDV